MNLPFPFGGGSNFLKFCLDERGLSPEAVSAYLKKYSRDMRLETFAEKCQYILFWCSIASIEGIDFEFASLSEANADERFLSLALLTVVSSL